MLRFAAAASPAAAAASATAVAATAFATAAATAAGGQIQAWNRLSVLYETHLRDRAACLDALQSGRDDDCVRGGERVELRQRRAASHRKYGTQLFSVYTFSYSNAFIGSMSWCPT